MERTKRGAWPQALIAGEENQAHGLGGGEERREFPQERGRELKKREKRGVKKGPGNPGSVRGKSTEEVAEEKEVGGRGTKRT